MCLIKKISESIALRKEEKELKQEEHLILREMAQERLAKKRALEQKQKVFDTMLDMKIPCADIIELKDSNGGVEYFQMMNANVLTMLLVLQEGVDFAPCDFKCLTGYDAGKIITINAPQSRGTRQCYLNPMDRSKLVVAIDGCFDTDLEQHFCEPTDLEKVYGEIISIKDLLKIWLIRNNISRDINIDKDYDMVKNIYSSKYIVESEKKLNK